MLHKTQFGGGAGCVALLSQEVSLLSPCVSQELEIAKERIISLEKKIEEKIMGSRK